jgi:hypothetical protein
MKYFEAISKIGFWFKFSRRRLAGQERGTDFQPADILKYFEELEFGPNTEIGTKGLFEMASILEVLFGFEIFKQGSAVTTIPCCPAARWTELCLSIILGT